MTLTIHYTNRGDAMPTLAIELEEDILKKIVISYLQSKLGEIKIVDRDIKVEVKTQQGEWLTGEYKATVTKLW